ARIHAPLHQHAVRLVVHTTPKESLHMPGLVSRTMTIIKAKYSTMLNRAENLDYSYEEQLRQLQNVRRGIADVTTAKKRLELQYTGMQQQVDKLDDQA